MVVTRHGIRELARTIRAHPLRMVHRANASHIATRRVSMADLLAVLYGKIPRWTQRDPLGRNVIALSSVWDMVLLSCMLSWQSAASSAKNGWTRTIRTSGEFHETI
jgi:transketolase